LAKFATAGILILIQGEAMPTRNVSLTAEQDAFVEKVVQAGEYQNASEAIRAALRVLQQQHREDALKLKALRIQVKAGVDALERGDFTEIEAADLTSYLEGLMATARIGPR
jgi:antitoxin ParD1/3/4